MVLILHCTALSCTVLFSVFHVAFFVSRFIAAIFNSHPSIFPLILCCLSFDFAINNFNNVNAIKNLKYPVLYRSPFLILKNQGSCF